MKKLFKYFPWITSGYLLVSHVIGLAGIPGDIETWQKWINITFVLSMKTTISQNFLQWIFLISGLLILFIYSDAHKKVWHKLRRSKRDLPTGSAPIEDDITIEREPIVDETKRTELLLEEYKGLKERLHSELLEDEEIINNTRSPLKIEVQEDGNSYLDTDFTNRLSLKDGQRCILSIKIHNTSDKSIDNVQVYINELNAPFNQMLDKSLIYIHYTDTDESIVSFSPHQKRSVNVLSYLNARPTCEFLIEQFNVIQKPKIFITEQEPCKIEITVTGKDVASTQQAFEVLMISEAQYDSLDSKRRRIFMKCISKEDPETIDFLKKQQRPKLEVTFEKGKKPYLEPFRKMSPFTKRDGKLYYYRIRIENTCSEIIKNVNVKLVEIKECPDDFSAERCNLEFMHHPGVKAKDIQPYDDDFVDIIGYFEPFNKDIKKKEMYMLTAGGMLKLYIPAENCDITIKINSDNGGKPIIKHFKFTPTRKNKEDFMEMD